MKHALMYKAAVRLIAASVGLAAGLANAQEAGSKPTREFAQAATNADQYEMLAASTALAQSRNPGVRDYAAHMLQDHQQLEKAVSDAATRSGLKPPAMAMSGDQAQLLGALQSVSGQEFDALYLKQQILAHASALVVQQMYAQSGDDPNLRQVAVSAVPLVAAHGEMAKQALTRLGGQ